MRLRDLRASALASAALSLVASGCQTPPPDGACSAIVPFAGAPTEALTVRDDAAVLDDGSATTLVLGPQGGYMITPTLVLDGAIADGDTVCAIVTLEHTDPDGGMRYEGFERLELAERLRRNAGGDLEAGPNLDQLRWAPLPPNSPLSLRVTVRGETFAATRTLALRLQPAAP